MKKNGYYWATFNDDELMIPTVIQIDNGLVYQMGAENTFPCDDVEIVSEILEPEH